MPKKSKNVPFSLSIGIILRCISDLPRQIRSTLNSFDFAGIHFFEQRILRFKEYSKDQNYTLSISDLDLTSDEWLKVINNVAETYFDCDSNIEHIREASEDMLTQELNFTLHISPKSVLLPFIPDKYENYARILHQVIYT